MLTCYWCAPLPAMRRYSGLTSPFPRSLAILFTGLLWLYTVRLNKQKAVQLAHYEKEQDGKEGLVDAWHDQVRPFLPFLLIRC
jgi:type VI protein secretion system component VasK